MGRKKYCWQKALVFKQLHFNTLSVVKVDLGSARKVRIIMIIVKVKGGLGNQMFQYAYYRSLSKIHDDVKMDITSYFKVCDLFVDYKLKYELDRIFNIPCQNYAMVEDIEKLSNYKNLRLYLLSIRLRHIVKGSGKIRDYSQVDKSTSLDTEESVKLIKNLLNKIILSLYRRFIFDDSKDTSSHIIERLGTFNKNYVYIKNVYYDGYWQNVNYFNDVLKEIYNEFTFKKPLCGKNKMIYEKILRQQLCPVSIHIRRGDYVGSSYDFLTNQYYEMAITEIEKLVKNPAYIVFSDDIAWVKRNLTILNEKYKFYVGWNKGEEAYKDMQLMSYCKHNIIANSTFSWWGAFLNKNKNKIIVSPSVFYKSKDLVLKRIVFPLETKVIVIDNS